MYFIMTYTIYINVFFYLSKAVLQYGNVQYVYVSCWEILKLDGKG